MTDTIFTGQTPGFNDSGAVTTRSLAMRGQVSASGKRISYGRYYVPPEGLGATTLYYIWDLFTGLRLVEVDLNTLPTPTPGAMMRFALGLDIFPVVARNYAFGVFLNGADHYMYSSGQTLPVGSGGSFSADTALFLENGTHDDVASNTGFVGGWYFVDAEVEDAGVEGTAAFLASGASFSAAGTSINPATAAFAAAVATLAGAGTSINPATSAVTAAAATTAAAGTSINPAAAAFTASAATSSAAGTSVNAGTAAFTATAATFAATDEVTPDNPGPAVLTPGGSTSTMTPGGTSPTLSPSGLP